MNTSDEREVKRKLKIIHAYVRRDNVCRQLMTVLGIGPLTSLAFKTIA